MGGRVEKHVAGLLVLRGAGDGCVISHTSLVWWGVPSSSPEGRQGCPAWLLSKGGGAG